MISYETQNNDVILNSNIQIIINNEYLEDNNLKRIVVVLQFYNIYQHCPSDDVI